MPKAHPREILLTEFPLPLIPLIARALFRLTHLTNFHPHKWPLPRVRPWHPRVTPLSKPLRHLNKTHLINLQLPGEILLSRVPLWSQLPLQGIHLSKPHRHPLLQSTPLIPNCRLKSRLPREVIHLSKQGSKGARLVANQ